MGVASLSSEAVPTRTLTPQEPLVETLRVALSKDVILVLTNPKDKTFLVTWLIKEWAWNIRNKVGSIIFLVANQKQVHLWTQFFLRTTDLIPSVNEPEEWDTSKPCFLITTVNEFAQMLNSGKALKISMLVVDNGHTLSESKDESVSKVIEFIQASNTSKKREQSEHKHQINELKSSSPCWQSRTVVFTANFLADSQSNNHLVEVDREFERLKNVYAGNKIETCCEILSLLRFIVDPTNCIVKYTIRQTAPEGIELEIRGIIEKCEKFLEDHKYELFDIYGPEYADLLEDIPNPLEAPTKMLQDFRSAFETLGVWCAERAALLLIIKIEKLKTCEKYERHFLLLSTIYTEMMRIQKICDVAFSELTEIEKMIQFSTPKLLKFLDILEEYKPEHIQKSVSREIKEENNKKSNNANLDSSNERETTLHLEKDEIKQHSPTDCQKATKTSEHLEVDVDEQQSKHSQGEDLPNNLSNYQESIENPIEYDTGVLGLDENSCDHLKENEIFIEDKADNKNTSPGSAQKDLQDPKTNSQEDISSSESPMTKDAVFEDIKEVETFQTHEAEDSLNAKEVIDLQSEPRETSSNDQEKRNRRKMSKNDQKMSNRHGSNRIVTGSPSRHSKGKSSNSLYSSYNDPDALCSVVFVENKFIAKVIYHFLKDLSRSDVAYSFLTPQYAIAGAGEIDTTTDSEGNEGEDGMVRKQEEALRRFRMRECNLLITNSLLEIGVDNVRCNLVVAFDPPTCFKSYVQYKVKAKAQNSWFILMCENDENVMSGLVENLAFYQIIEDKLKNECNFQGPVIPINQLNHASDNEDSRRLPSSFLSTERKFHKLRKNSPSLQKGVLSGDIVKFKVYESILYLNRYCAKLPSDTFTRLSPIYDIFDSGPNTFVCAIQLPINSPLKEVVVGPSMNNRDLAMKAAALKVCLKLQKILELDEFMLPIGKDASGSHYHPKISQQKNSNSKASLPTNTNSKVSSSLTNNGIHANTENFRDARPGTTKRRQYYYKQVASCLKMEDSLNNSEGTIDVITEDLCSTVIEESKNNADNLGEDVISEVQQPANEQTSYFLYSLHLKLTCAIPEDQNTRGRKINDPEESNQKFGILVKDEMPPVSEFPIYTRSGEVFVTTKLLNDAITLTEESKNLVLKFHDYTFSKVLRLVKYPMIFSPNKAENSIIVLPLKVTKPTNGKEEEGKDDIDWEFLKMIGEVGITKIAPVQDEDRKGFEFSKSRYADAVIMPWYRNQDQPQYFYVAEICSHLSPTSDFPGQGFETFEKYYLEKYNIKIQNLTQPLLDVDHTSARLNFLTPRYVNRKGVALPTSSEETKKSKRENLDQKQILVPELCAIHPFPASLWRQTVCLPCILYRLNGLLIANQLRAVVAIDTKICQPKLLRNHHWPALTFGWTLSDVLTNRNSNPNSNNANNKGIQNCAKANQSTKKLNASDSRNARHRGNNEVQEETNEDELGCLTNQLLSKLNEEDSKVKSKSNLDIGMWSNDMINEAKLKEQQRLDDEEEMDEFEEMEQLFGGPDVALPDNLTILDTSILPMRSNGGTDWGTGIAQRPFRVGSPTFFSNPNINIPGVMDEYDRFSCSDVSDVDNMDDFDDHGHNGEGNDKSKQDAKEGEDVGDMTIEFHGDNMAEAVENEIIKKRRNETLAKDLEEESEMVLNIPWQWDQSEGDSLNACMEITNKTNETRSPQSNLILECNENFCKNKVRKRNDRCDEIDQLSAMLNEIGDEDNQDPEVKNLVRTFERQINVIPCDNDGKSVSEDRDDSAFNGVIPWESDDEFSFSFDLQPKLSEHTGPSPSLILQSLTMSNSNDAINLERLETIGDSFLKYATTAYLFSINSSVHEGRLSHLRSKYVSNLNLYKLGKRKGLGQFMIATKFEPHDNWLPPCYYVPKEIEQALIQSGVPETHWNMAELPNLQDMNCEQICNLVREKSNFKEGDQGSPRHANKLKTNDKVALEKLPSFVPYNLLTQHSIPDKSIADCVEALIGAYLIACGPKGALVFMKWLGLDLLSSAPEKLKSSKEEEEQERRINAGDIFPIPLSPLLDNSKEGQIQLDFLLNGYDKFEELIGYKFRDRSYLLQAFTHASYYPNRLTDCYQRLEFLGDAVLDYLITRHLYEDPRQHSPGALTDLRSALVNNTIFASLAVKYQFHKYFKHFSPGLQSVVNRFVNLQSDNENKGSERCVEPADIIIAEDFYLVGDGEEGIGEEAEDVEVPKALGDIFESIAGAIFLDGGLKLDAVWNVYYRMMKKEIIMYSENVPKSPIRELLELEPETAKFGKPEKLADGRRVRVSVEVFGKGVYKGIGRNYRIAKCTAAKCALRAIRKNSSDKN